jgi:D-3-phosphoglycerate dehydrogenase / 2-oxoglutarate reductase
VRILVAGDSFVSADVFRRGLGPLEATHEVTYVQVDETRTPEGLPLREYAGDPDELAAQMTGVEILVVHGAAVTDEVLGASDALRLVCCARGGPVNVDIAAASARSLPVVSTPGKNAEAVADQALAFMVMLARRFPYAQRFLLEGNSVGESAFEGARFFGHELGGQTLGLVGYGNVGHRVARRARSFGMNVVVFDPFVELDAAPDVEQVDDLDALLERADFVSLHARATADNENLFGRREFARMKPGAYFLNTARETLVDEEALDEALESGRLAGAALDVVRPTADDGAHPLLRHDNVVLTPHIGGATHETLLRGAQMIAAEIERFAAGEPLLNVINREAVGA